MCESAALQVVDGGRLLGRWCEGFGLDAGGGAVAVLDDKLLYRRCGRRVPTQQADWEVEVAAEAEHGHHFGQGDEIDVVALDEVGVSVFSTPQFGGSEGSPEVAFIWVSFMKILIERSGNRDFSKVVDSVLLYLLGLDEVGAADMAIL